MSNRKYTFTLYAKPDVESLVAKPGDGDATIVTFTFHGTEEGFVGFMFFIVVNLAPELVLDDMDIEKEIFFVIKQRLTAKLKNKIQATLVHFNYVRLERNKLHTDIFHECFAGYIAGMNLQQQILKWLPDTFQTTHCHSQSLRHQEETCSRPLMATEYEEALYCGFQARVSAKKLT
jgi:hypothetical protein